jgi:hypothetical protein
VLPVVIAQSFGVAEPIRAIPIREREACPVIGLVYPHREPLLPLTAALVTQAHRLGAKSAAG